NLIPQISHLFMVGAIVFILYRSYIEFCANCIMQWIGLVICIPFGFIFIFLQRRFYENHKDWFNKLMNYSPRTVFLYLEILYFSEILLFHKNQEDVIVQFLSNFL